MRFVSLLSLFLVLPCLSSANGRCSLWDQYIPGKTMPFKGHSTFLSTEVADLKPHPVAALVMELLTEKLPGPGARLVGVQTTFLDLDLAPGEFITASAEVTDIEEGKLKLKVAVESRTRPRVLLAGVFDVLYSPANP